MGIGKEDHVRRNDESSPSTPSSLKKQQLTPDRSPSSRALIVHPQFKERHPIYHLLDKHLETWRCVEIPGFQLPFIIHQNCLGSKEHLGSVVWAAGIAAAAYISQENMFPSDFGDITCLELGCGAAAVVSQCAALRGMKCVMTDLPEVLEWAKQNVMHNREQWNGHPQLRKAIEKSDPGSVSPLLSARTLRWGEPSDIPPDVFDVVVAADCLYATRDDPDLQDKLLFTIKGLLANGRTQLLLSYQLRTGKERSFVYEILPAVLPACYSVEEIVQEADSGVHAMVWVRAKKAIPKDVGS